MSVHTKPATPPHERLAFIGRRLYGERWVLMLATALRINPRTFKRLLKGEREIPPGVWSELANLCRARGRELQRLAGELMA